MVDAAFVGVADGIGDLADEAKPLLERERCAVLAQPDVDAGVVEVRRENHRRA